MAHPTTKTEMLATQKDELIKQYVEFDGQNRVSKVYTTKTNAANGEPCTVTEYIYTSPTSTVMKARKEGHSTWSSAWDADFTITA